MFASSTTASADDLLNQSIGAQILRTSHKQIHAADLFYLPSKLFAGDKLALKGLPSLTTARSFGFTDGIRICFPLFCFANEVL